MVSPYSIYESPLGKIVLFSNGTKLTQLCFEDSRSLPAGLLASKAPKMAQGLAIFAEAHRWLDLYFSGHEPDFTPAYELPESTPFRLHVWQILPTIRYGQVASYCEVASRVAKRFHTPLSSSRSVGSALSLNPLPLLLPCHRIIGTNGYLLGTTGASARKRALLELEKADPHTLFGG